jgi:hypothetical protein
MVRQTSLRSEERCGLKSPGWGDFTSWGEDMSIFKYSGNTRTGGGIGTLAGRPKNVFSGCALD